MSIRLLAYLVLVVAIPCAQGSECDNWQQQHPEWLWCDSFESADALLEYGDRKTTTESPQGMDISTADAFDGLRSLRQAYSPGQVNAGWIIKINDYPDNLFVRFYHKFEDGDSSFAPKMARVGFRDRSTWTEIMRVHLWIHDTGEQHALIADTLARDSTQNNGSGWLPAAFSNHYLNAPENINRWVSYELQIQLNTPCQSNGLYRVWADDRLIVNRTNVDLRGCKTYGINEVMLDTYWNGGANAALSRYYDNLVISTSKIGRHSSINPPRPPFLTVE